MHLHRLFLAALLGSALAPSHAREQGATTDASFIKAAELGGPAAIGAQAAIFRVDPAKKTVAQLRPGSNGFTCTLFPDESKAPVCADKNAWAWLQAAFAEQPKPPAGDPGIAYMAQGGIHYEKPNGDIVMMSGADTKSVKEPPHWMLMWPFDAVGTGLPTKPNAGGVYVMFAGTPYAHLMIYHDPNAIK